MRKPSGMLFQLPLEQRTALVQWLMDDVPTLTYAQAQERLRSEFNVEAGISMLSVFYAWYAEQRLLERVAERAQSTHAVNAAAERNHSQTFEAIMELSGQATYGLRVESPQASLEELNRCMEIAARGMRARNAAGFLRIKQREVALMERKYADKVADKPKKRNPVTGNAMEIIAARLKI